MQRSSTLALSSRAFTRLVRCPAVRFNSSDTSQPAPTTVRRATIPMVQDLGGVSLGSKKFVPGTAPVWQADLSALAVDDFGTERTANSGSGLASRLALRRLPAHTAHTPPAQARAPEQVATPTQGTPSPSAPEGASPKETQAAAAPAPTRSRMSIQALGALYVPEESLKLQMPSHGPQSQRMSGQRQPGQQQRAQYQQRGQQQQSYQQRGQQQQGYQQRGQQQQQQQQRQGFSQRGPQQQGAQQRGQQQEGFQQRGPQSAQQPDGRVQNQGGRAQAPIRRTAATGTRPANRRPGGRRGGDENVDENGPSKVDSLAHLPKKIDLGGTKLDALFAPRQPFVLPKLKRPRTRAGRSRPPRSRPIGLVPGKPISGRTHLFRELAAGDYSRFRPARINVGPHVNALKPELLARAALSHNRAATLGTRKTAMGVVKRAIAFAPTGARAEA